LHIYQRIITESEDFLREEGHLAVEVGAGQHQKIAALFAQRSHWKVIEMRADLGSIPRALVARFCPLHKG
ncbi:MAG: protein-(glutamine-N5) methyltransferase, release factor-specific, partial [Acidobacteriota bacterium]